MKNIQDILDEAYENVNPKQEAKWEEQYEKTKEEIDWLKQVTVGTYFLDTKTAKFEAKLTKLIKELEYIRHQINKNKRYA